MGVEVCFIAHALVFAFAHQEGCELLFLDFGYREPLVEVALVELNSYLALPGADGEARLDRVDVADAVEGLLGVACPRLLVQPDGRLRSLLRQLRVQHQAGLHWRCSR